MRVLMAALGVNGALDGSSTSSTRKKVRICFTKCHTIVLLAAHPVADLNLDMKFLHLIFHIHDSAMLQAAA